MNAATTWIEDVETSHDDPPDAPAVSPRDDCAPARVATAEWRARAFLAALSPARRAEVARRPRFYSIPWLRRADEPADPDDELP